MTQRSDFWNALAPHHAAIENNYLDLPNVRRIAHKLQPPVLVVGAGQGLIVAELREQGMRCDGVDLSSEMIRYAKIRRDLDLIEADARSLPFADGEYGTILYATGVVDFLGDDEEITGILAEGRRVVGKSGTVFVAFYRLSAAMEDFVARVGLLQGNVLALRKSLEMYLLNPAQTISWVAKQMHVGHLRAALLLILVLLRSTKQEKAMTVQMQKIFKRMPDAKSLIKAALEQQPYRNEAEIRNLFRRLAIPVGQLQSLGNCCIVEV